MDQGISRRQALKSFSCAASSLLLTSQFTAPKSELPSRIKYIGGGFYSVNGWVVSKRELNLN